MQTRSLNLCREFMIGTREEAVARLRRTKHRAEAAAWLARAAGVTSRDAVLYSLLKSNGCTGGASIIYTLVDGSGTMDCLIDDDALAGALAFHLERCGAPTFSSYKALDVYTAALEKGLQAGLTPVPARDAALQAVRSDAGTDETYALPSF